MNQTETETNPISIIVGQVRSLLGITHSASNQTSTNKTSFFLSKFFIGLVITIGVLVSVGIVLTTLFATS